MKLHIFLIFLFISSFVYSQDGPIRVHLKSGEVVSTNYVFFANGTIFGPANVRVDEKNGRKFTVFEVDHVEGSDNDGQQRYFRPIPFSGGVIWGERVHNAGSIELFYTSMTQFTNATTSYTSRYYRYSKNGGPLEKLNKRNVKRDLADCEECMKEVHKGSGIRAVQLVLYATGATLIATGIADDLARSDDKSEKGFPPTVIAGAVILYIPFLLHGPRQGRFVTALEMYKGPATEDSVK